METAVNKKSTVAYELDSQRRHKRMGFDFPEGLEEDAWLVKFPGSEDLCFYMPPPPGHEVYFPIGGGKNGQYPERVEFMADYNELEVLDYPDVEQSSWPIMSKRMLKTLLSVRKFAYRAFPVVMLNANYIYDRDKNEFRPGTVENHDFIALQTLEFLDILDLDKSDCRLGKDGKVRRIEKPVFKVPPEGLPPIFRITPHKNRLFVSAEAKAALNASEAGRGAKYTPLERCTFYCFGWLAHSYP